MFDPAAIATAIIGLERIRREDEQYARGMAQPARQQHRQRPVRHRVGATLRRTADLIDPAPVPAR